MASSTAEIDMKRNKCLFSNMEVCNLGSVIYDDLLENVLLALDVRNLFRCLSVSKAWHSFISSSRFRQKWQQISRYRDDEDSWVLLSCAKMGEVRPSWTDLWTSARGVCRFSPVGPDIQVVASSHGLVCAISMAKFPATFALMVGNPLTKEWFRLPPNTEYRFTNPYQVSRCQVRIELLDRISGAYRVAVCDVWGAYNDHDLYVYDSVSNIWSHESNEESGRPGPERVYFDLHQYEWITLLKSNRIEPPNILPSKDGILPLEAVETLPSQDSAVYLRLPPSQGICLWRHKGSLYLGSTWGLSDGYDGVAATGMGVWEVHEGHVSKVATVRAEMVEGFESIKMDKVTFLFSGEGNVMCAGGTQYIPSGIVSLPIIVCNLRNQSWHKINNAEEHYYSIGIAYRPSLIPVSLTINI